MHIALEATKEAGNSITFDDFSKFTSDLKEVLPSTSHLLKKDVDIKNALSDILRIPTVNNFLIQVSRADVFGNDAAVRFSHSKDELLLLRSFKLLKYCYNLPCGQLCNILSMITTPFDKEYSSALSKFASRVLSDETYGSLLMRHITIAKDSDPSLKKLYSENAEYLLDNDPHALYPTSIYRQCDGHVTSSSDSKVIEAVMGTKITTTIEIVREVLNPSNNLLRDVYKPLKRCVAIVDERLDGLYGDALTNYFEVNSIGFEKLVYRCMEVDKDISTVEKILVDLKGRRVSRNEPVLVVGGGVMADVGGFACALYHRNTPYVMLCTSIVSGIDAGPSPRTCCDGLGYKNVFGAYHPPILTITDRQFFKTLEPGWIRHGIAEIIKMAVVKDASLFECLERAGDRLVKTQFGIENCDRGSEIDELSETIIAKAMDGYVRSEYGNLWETHQCRPHAYGHTWSPGFELQAGLLHGHAVSVGMGFGAYLSFQEGWITEEDLHRILKVKMTEKRGGNLCAPVPKGKIGVCGYINDVSRERLEQSLLDYQELVKQYPREGLGIEPHCKDVGLEDPSAVKQHADNAVPMNSLSNGTSNGTIETHSTIPIANGSGSNIDKYNEWIANKQKSRNEGATSSAAAACAMANGTDRHDTPHPPKFDHETLFYPGAEDYACAMTTSPHKDYVRIAKETEKAALFAPCMVGAVEGQFLKMIAQISKAKRVLDIGTFTGNSALAFAEGIGANGKVVSIEADIPTAKVAQGCFDKSKCGDRIELLVTDARAAVKEMADKGEKFDIVFLDADKINYKHYYEAGLSMLNDGGIVMADNALCSLVYDNEDPVRQSLHEFGQYVRKDSRVEQVMLTVREGILIVRKV